jgi:hypothetical protein
MEELVNIFNSKISLKILENELEIHLIIQNSLHFLQILIFLLFTKEILFFLIQFQNSFVPPNFLSIDKYLLNSSDL